MEDKIVILSSKSILPRHKAYESMCVKVQRSYFLRKELLVTEDGQYVSRSDKRYVEVEGVALLRDSAVRGFDETTNVVWLKKSDDLIHHRGQIYKNDEALRKCGFIRLDGHGIISAEKNKAYHSGSRQVLNTTAEYRIGFEVEKEDAVMVEEPAEKVSLLTKWDKERDGSLGSDGFELVSPAYGLNSMALKTALQNQYLISLLNARSSEKCGGHINLSCKSCRPYDLGVSLKSWMTLLYAMFPKRTTNGYCRMMKFEDYVHNRAAINFKPYALEMRIFPAVRDVDDLTARIKLITTMVNNRDVSHQVLYDQLDKYADIITAVSHVPMANVKKNFVTYSAIDDININL